MTSRATLSIQYPAATLNRADRALRCAPFHLGLFTRMVEQSVSLQSIAGAAGVQQGYTTQSLSELAAEAELLWLIQVGLLRREVDGQGLTDSFRVTPLGRQLVHKWSTPAQSAANLAAKFDGEADLAPIGYTPNWRDRLYNSLNRWLRVRI